MSRRGSRLNTRGRRLNTSGRRLSTSGRRLSMREGEEVDYKEEEVEGAS